MKNDFSKYKGQIVLLKSCGAIHMIHTYFPISECRIESREFRQFLSRIRCTSYYWAIYTVMWVEYEDWLLYWVMNCDSGCGALHGGTGYSAARIGGARLLYPSWRPITMGCLISTTAITSSRHNTPVTVNEKILRYLSLFQSILRNWSNFKVQSSANHLCHLNLLFGIAGMLDTVNCISCPRDII